MREYFNNGAQTTLSGGINNSVTSATLTSSSGWPEAPFRALITAEGGNTDEIIYVGARSGTALSSIVRAYEAIADGTQVAQAHSSGATITQVFTEGSRRNTTPFVATQSRQSKKYEQRDGTWRNPLLVGEGTVSVGSPSTLTDDSKYNAWPIICRMRDSRLLAVYTKGDSHHLDNTGKAVGKIAVEDLNGTLTWGSEFTIYQDTTPLFASAYGVTCISTGRVFVTLWKDDYATSGTGQAGYVYSDDFGVSWTGWKAFSTSFTQEAFSAGPVVELANGDLLVTIEGSNTGDPVANRSSHTLRSTDHGLTWGSEVTVRNYVTDSRPYYESKLLLLDNDTLLVIHRTSGGTGTIYISTSTDGGLTWGAPVSAVSGYGAPSTIQASTGTLFLTTRKNSDASVVLYTSIDRGVTWSSGTSVDATMFEMEYACPLELLDGSILIIYGYQVTSSTSNSDIKLITITEDTTELTIPTGGGGGAILATVDVVLSGNVTMTTAGTVYDGPSASFAAGIWVYWIKALFQSSGGPITFRTRLWDGSTIYDEGETYTNQSGYRVSISGQGIVVLGSPATLKLSVDADTNGQTLKRDGGNGTTHTATRLTAIQIA